VRIQMDKEVVNNHLSLEILGGGCCSVNFFNGLNLCLLFGYDLIVDQNLLLDNYVANKLT
jgi:hypothetical protein